VLTACGNSVEDRLQLIGRTRDDAEHLTDRGLIFQRSREFRRLDLDLSCSSLLCLEQPRVLNGDDGLVGEGLDKCNLIVSECTSITACDSDRPDRLPSAHQRHAEKAPETSHARRFSS